MTSLRSESSTILRSVPWPVGLFSAAWIMLAIYWQWLVHADGILGDMWDMLPGYQHLHEMDVAALWKELTSQYARVHVLAIPKLFFWINFAFFGGSGAILKVVSFVLCFANGALLLVLTAKEWSGRIKLYEAVLVFLLIFFNGFQTLVIDWDFLLQHYLAIFFSLSAFYVYERFRCLSLVFFLVLLAGLSCGSGLVTLTSLGLLLLIKRERLPIIIAYGLFSALLLTVIFPQFSATSAETMRGAQNNFFWAAPELLLQYLSYPFSAWGDFRWLGLLLLVMVCQSFYRCVRSNNARVTDFLVCYFFLIACSIVWGRYRYLASDADLSRFYVYIAPLWVLSLLRVSEFGRLLFRYFSVLLCSLLAVGGLCAVAVAADHAGRMDMARVVALNGNFSHLASLRLNAMTGKYALQQHAGYLHERSMDIYWQQVLSLSDKPLEDGVCHLLLQRNAAVSKRQFVDYFFYAQETGGKALTALYATDQSLAVRYQGVAVQSVNRKNGWQVPLSAISWRDWSLLLPVKWLPSSEVLLYTHIPQQEKIDSLLWWAVTSDGQRCRVVVDAVIEAPE